MIIFYYVKAPSIWKKAVDTRKSLINLDQIACRLVELLLIRIGRLQPQKTNLKTQYIDLVLLVRYTLLVQVVSNDTSGEKILDNREKSIDYITSRVRK